MDVSVRLTFKIFPWYPNLIKRPLFNDVDLCNAFHIFWFFGEYNKKRLSICNLILPYAHPTVNAFKKTWVLFHIKWNNTHVILCPPLRSYRGETVLSSLKIRCIRNRWKGCPSGRTALRFQIRYAPSDITPRAATRAVGGERAVCPGWSRKIFIFFPGAFSARGGASASYLNRRFTTKIINPLI